MLKISEPKLRDFVTISSYLLTTPINDFNMAQQPLLSRASSVSRLQDHTQTHHIQQDSSERVIGPSQRPLLNNTQHSKETDIHDPSGLRHTIVASQRPHSHTLDRAATSIGSPHLSMSHLHTLLELLIYKLHQTMNSRNSTILNCAEQLFLNSFTKRLIKQSYTFTLTRFSS